MGFRLRTNCRCLRRLTMLVFLAGVLLSTYSAAADTRCAMHLCACAMRCCQHAMPSPTERVSSDCRRDHGSSGIVDDDSEDPSSIIALAEDHHIAIDATLVCPAADVAPAFQPLRHLGADDLSCSERAAYLINSVFRI